jgi:hypothetical protein
MVDFKDFFCEVASHNMRGFRNLMFFLCITFLVGSFVFLYVDPSILFLVFPAFFVWSALFYL